MVHLLEFRVVLRHETLFSKKAESAQTNYVCSARGLFRRIQSMYRFNLFTPITCQTCTTAAIFIVSYTI